MKWLFLLLVLANGLFYGYTRLAEPPTPQDWKSREVKADKLKMVAAEPPKPVITPLATEAAVVSVEPTSTEKPADAKPEPKPEETKPDNKAALACFAWRGILPEDLPNARKKLAALKLGGELKVENNEPDTPKRYWVYIPARPSAEDAQKKADELKTLGVEDFFVVNDGTRWNHAISLGLYSSKEAADRRLEAVKQKGVRTAVSKERGEAMASNSLILKHVSKQAKSALSEAASGFKGSSVAESGC